MTPLHARKDRRPAREVSGVGVDIIRTAPYRSRMSADTETRGAEEARNTLPTLLELAERGRATVITKHGRRVAAIVPIDQYEEYLSSRRRSRQRSLLSHGGSGAGLWGEDSADTIRKLRDEWTR